MHFSISLKSPFTKLINYWKNLISVIIRVRRYRLSKTVRVGENGVEEEDKEELLGSKGTRL